MATISPAARRADTISAELAKHTFDIDQQNLAVTKDVHEVAQEIAELTRRIDGLTKLIHDHVMKTTPKA